MFRTALIVLLLVTVLAAISLSAQVQPTRWSGTDVVLASTFLASQIWDHAQTMSRRDDPRFRERNPILGPHPSKGDLNTYFVTTTVLVGAAATFAPNGTVRKVVLGGGTILNLWGIARSGRLVVVNGRVSFRFP